MRFVRDEEVVRIARQRRPAKRSASFAEKRTDEERHEAADVERILHAGLQRLTAQVVAVVERDRAAALQLQHRAHVAGHRVVRKLDVRVRAAVAHRQRRVVRDSGGNVAIQLVVRRGLIGEDVGNDVALDQRFEQLDCIRDDADRHRLAARRALRARARSRRRATAPARRDSACRDGAECASDRLPPTSAVASFIVAASGCAPPIPPSPAVTTSFPRSELSKRVFATEAKHSNVPCRMPCVPM